MEIIIFTFSLARISAEILYLEHSKNLGYFCRKLWNIGIDLTLSEELTEQDLNKIWEIDDLFFSAKE